MTEERNSDAKYVQQHLANERTFLAWIRTAIAIVGLGFLAAGVVFHSTPYDYAGTIIVAVVSFGGVLWCLRPRTILLSRKAYLWKDSDQPVRPFSP